MQLPLVRAVDESDRLGFRCIEKLAGHQKLFRFGKANKLGPDDRAAVARDEADRYVRITDLGAVRHEGDVAE